MSLPQPVRCLVFSASLRRDSLNSRLGEADTPATHRVEQ